MRHPCSSACLGCEPSIDVPRVVNCRAARHVRFGSLADITTDSSHVRFNPERGHKSVSAKGAARHSWDVTSDTAAGLFTAYKPVLMKDGKTYRE